MRLRLLVDQSGEDVFLKTDRTPSQLLRDAIQVMREANRRQSVFRLCLHLSDDTLTFHWHADDEKFAAAIVSTAETIQRAMIAILKGEVPA
ncbi:MAG: hypothetical protein ABFC88_14785 [Thermoguttaceae bacterium]